jgi:D-serine deaminase-like pyridoxal phosphate-dependent protein
VGAAVQDLAGMNLAELPTPCLVLDRTILARNIRGMAETLLRLNVPLRPHMKTAKSIDVARLALAGQPGGITVSTLAEAEYFFSHGITDILYAVGITPQKLERVCKLNAAGAQIIVITDDLATAATIAAQPAPPATLIEIDSGEQRGGVGPAGGLLLQLAGRLGACLRGVMTHAGHSYAGRGVSEIARIAEAERMRSPMQRRACAMPATPSRSSRPAAHPPRGTRKISPALPRCAPGSTCSAICSRQRSRPMASTPSR